MAHASCLQINSYPVSHLKNTMFRKTTAGFVIINKIELKSFMNYHYNIYAKMLASTKDL